MSLWTEGRKNPGTSARKMEDFWPF